MAVVQIGQMLLARVCVGTLSQMGLRGFVVKSKRSILDETTVDFEKARPSLAGRWLGSEVVCERGVHRFGYRGRAPFEIPEINFGLDARAAGTITADIRRTGL